MHIAQSKTRSVADQFNRLRAAEMSVVQAALNNGYLITDALTQRELRERVETASDGKNTVLFTDEGVPGIYVRIPANALALGSLATELGISGLLHEAFKVGGAWKDEILIGKYQGFMVNHTTGARIDNDASTAIPNARVACLPMTAPGYLVNFDLCLNSCANNGSGYHLISNPEWSYLYLLTLANGREVRGNNNNLGADYVRTDETCKWATGDESNKRGLAGSGPVSWTHDGTPYGVYDLNGNVWEWCSQLRLNAGEIQILEEFTGDHTAVSTDWKTIDSTTGNIVAAGSAGSLKIDSIASVPVISDTITSSAAAARHTQFNALTANITVPARAKRLGLYPLATSPTRGRFYSVNVTERLPVRGGGWSNASFAGVAALGLNLPRSNRIGSFGFRPAFAT